MTRQVRVVLVRPRNPQNIGACARALANFGFSDLAVVDPYEPVWKETRAAPGAEALVLKARRYPDIAQATKGFSVILGTSSFHQRPMEQAIVDLPLWTSRAAKWPAGRMAVLFGSERSGLSNDELSCCRAILRVPTSSGTPSMNLAQAVAVVLYELTRSGAGPPKQPQRSSSSGPDLEGLIRCWMDLAAATGYPPGYTPAARAGRIRRAVREIKMSADAQHFLLSFSRWMRKKLP